MACSLSNVKALSGAISRATKRYASSSSQSHMATGPAKIETQMVKRLAKEAVPRSEGKVAWVPDPRTGFYRPENALDEVDVAELRSLLLRKH